MATERTRGADGRFLPLDASSRTRKKSIKLTQRQREQAGEGLLDKHWRTYFLQALAETSNVKASARIAGISPSRAYKVRREDPAFAAQWREALIEGYEHLEMEALGYLRAADPSQKFDVANAIRLLGMHRETVAQERARDSGRDEQAVIESLDAVIEQMRQRRAANAAIIAETARGGHEQV